MIEEPRPIRYRLSRAQSIKRFEVLRHDPDPLPDPTVPRRDLHAEDARLAFGGVAQPLENFDGSCLAFAVQAAEGEHLAPVHFEVDSVDRGDVRIPLDESVDLNHMLAQITAPRSRRQRVGPWSFRSRTRGHRGLSSRFGSRRDAPFTGDNLGTVIK